MKIDDLTRRDVLKLGVTAAAVVALDGVTGCVSAPKIAGERPDYAKDIVLANCTLIDVKKGAAVKNARLRIRGGRMVPDAGEAPVETIDLGGRYVIPGLIDAHCHTTVPGGSFMTVAVLAGLTAQITRNFIQHITSGVTTIRDMGAIPGMLHNNLEKINDGDIPGPRVVYCNSILNIDKSHPDIDPRDVTAFAGIAKAMWGEMALNYRNRQELERCLEENTKNGASFIKLTMDNKSMVLGREDIPVYPDDDLRYIFGFAERKGLPVSGHHMLMYGFNRALQYPFNSVEHIVADGYLDDRQVRAMAEKKVAIVPTMILGNLYGIEEAYDKLPDEYRTDFIMNEVKLRREYFASITEKDVAPSINRTNLEAVTRYRKYTPAELLRKKMFLSKVNYFFGTLKYGPDNLRRMKQAGVLIGCGTDAGVPFDYHGTLWREMEMYARIGLKNDEILRCATVNNARILGIDDRTGSLEEGKCADLVVLEKNPLENISAVRNPLLVMKEGMFAAQREELKRGSAGRMLLVPAQGR